MFEKFLNNDICRDIFFWLINHSTGDYDAAIIAYDLNILDIHTFTAYIYIFNELGILSVDESSETLRVIFNEDSLIVKSFKTLQETFDNEAYRNSSVCAAFVSIESGFLNSAESNIMDTVQSLTDKEREDFFRMVEDPYNFELSEDPDVAMVQEALLARIKELEEDGELENLVDYMKRNLYI